MGKIRDIISRALDVAGAKSTLDAVGEAMVQRVKTRTRLGKGVKEPEARPHRLPKLKEKTVKTRKGLKRQGKLTGPGATPAKSGLNRTGQMLDSLKHEPKNDKVELKLDSKGTAKASKLEQLNKDFTFMNLSEPEVKAAVEIIEAEIQKKIK